jgi:exodeoxyribonuclease VII large subunit
MHTRLHNRRVELRALAARLQRVHAGVQVARTATRVQSLESRLVAGWRKQHGLQAHRLALAARGLEAVSPLAVLSRGYAVVTGPDGGIVRRASALKAGERIEARVAEGHVVATVVSTRS